MSNTEQPESDSSASQVEAPSEGNEDTTGPLSDDDLAVDTPLFRPFTGPHVVDGAAMQRRKRGLISASQQPGNVIPFPSMNRTTVRSEEREQPCQSGADDTGSSTPALIGAGATSPRSPKRRPQGAGRGPSQIGVLMPTLSLPDTLSGYRPQDVGLLTHAAIAILAPHAQSLSPVQLPARVLDVCGDLVNGDNVNRRRVLLLTATGHVCTYFRRYCPTAEWALLGAEFDTSGGRTDVAWRHTSTGQVFFDELKTHNRAINDVGSDTVAQAKRQGEGGDRLYGDAFTGVRVIPFGALHLVTLVHPARKRQPLAPTPSQPLRPREEVVS